MKLTRPQKAEKVRAVPALHQRFGEELAAVLGAGQERGNQ